MEPITEFACPLCCRFTLEAESIDDEGLPHGTVRCTNIRCPYIWFDDEGITDDL